MEFHATEDDSRIGRAKEAKAEARVRGTREVKDLSMMAATLRALLTIMVT
jgi:hypothetical protein